MWCDQQRPSETCTQSFTFECFYARAQSHAETTTKNVTSRQSTKLCAQNARTLACPNGDMNPLSGIPRLEA